jgi:hypothetical protein
MTTPTAATMPTTLQTVHTITLTTVKATLDYFIFRAGVKDASAGKSRPIMGTERDQMRTARQACCSQ